VSQMASLDFASDFARPMKTGKRSRHYAQQTFLGTRNFASSSRIPSCARTLGTAQCTGRGTDTTDGFWRGCADHSLSPHGMRISGHQSPLLLDPRSRHSILGARRHSTGPNDKKLLSLNKSGRASLSKSVPLPRTETLKTASRRWSPSFHRRTTRSPLPLEIFL
jgi:hypothetical protein